jgi:hypothetical protein
MFPSLFLSLFNSLFPLFYDPYQPITPAASTAAPRLTFQLRHLHAVSEHGHVLFSDIDHTLSARNLTAYSLRDTLSTRGYCRLIGHLHLMRSGMHDIDP